VSVSRSLLARFLAILSSRVVGFLALFAATPVIVRVLGRADYGTYAFLLSTLGVLMLFVDGGLFDGIRKFMTEADRPDGWADRVFAFYARVGAVLVVVIASALVVASALGLPGRLFGPEFDRLFVALAGLVVARQSGAIVRSGLMGLGRERVSESFQIANKIVGVGAGLALLFAGRGVVGLLVGRLVGHLVLAVGGGVVLLGSLDRSVLFQRTPDSFPARRLLSFNAGSFILFALYVSILHLDVLLIQWFRGSEATAVYKAALTVAEFLWFVPRILQVTLVHSTSELWSDGDRERVTEVSARTTRYTLALTLLMVIGLAALSRPFVTTYYGADFAPAVEPLLILLPGALCFAIARPILAVGQGNGDLRQLVYATAGAAVVNLVGNLLLIPRLGIGGAAVATTAGYCSMFVFHLWSARAIGFDPVADLRTGRIAVAGAASAVPIFLLAGTIHSDLLALLVVPPVGFVVYAAVALVSGAVPREELSDL
jgi:O-antigen/teichoic acid export membrane protein